VCGVAASVGAWDAVAGIEALLHRGPDACGAWTGGSVALAHTRLAILDLDDRSNQPFRAGSTVVSYNGELWNHAEVRDVLERAGRQFGTTGDTEVVAAALDEWGTGALRRMNGMFAVAWTSDGRHLFAARDRYGEMPLHLARRPGGAVVASELKAIEAITGSPAAEWVEPGEVVTVDASGRLEREFWYRTPAHPGAIRTREEAASRARELIALGCRERAISDVPVCALLSGGVDSSAVLLHLREHVPGLVAFTAVLDERSRDLRCARAVADELDVELVEVSVFPPTARDLEEVVDVIEMPHKAQVEIAWPCLALAREMRDRGFKVVFSGEGSDELWGSYGFAWHAVNAGRNWHHYRRELFLTQHRKNFARCNKVFMAHGVECRLPFLHPPLVEFALSVPAALCFDNRPVDKALLRSAYEGLLPEEVTRRSKQAFQDGLGLKQLIAETIPDARQLYAEEYRRRFEPDDQLELV